MAYLSGSASAQRASDSLHGRLLQLGALRDADPALQLSTGGRRSPKSDGATPGQPVGAAQGLIVAAPGVAISSRRAR